MEEASEPGVEIIKEDGRIALIIWERCKVKWHDFKSTVRTKLEAGELTFQCEAAANQ